MLLGLEQSDCLVNGAAPEVAKQGVETLVQGIDVSRSSSLWWAGGLVWWLDQLVSMLSWLFCQLSCLLLKCLWCLWCRIDWLYLLGLLARLNWWLLLHEW